MVNGLEVRRVDERRLQPHHLAAELLLQVVAELGHGIAAGCAVRGTLAGKRWRGRLERAGLEQLARGQRRFVQVGQCGGKERRGDD